MKLKIHLLFMVCIFGLHFLQAQNTYIGPNNGDWNTASNWSFGTAPISIGGSQSVMVPQGKTVVITDQVTMTGGSILGPGKIKNNGSFIITAHSYNKYFLNGLTFTNNGTMEIGTGTQNWNSYGNIKVGVDSKIVNASNGLITIKGAGIQNDGDQSGFKFENNGTIQKIGDSSEDISANMQNTGTINVTGGTLVLNAVENSWDGGTYNVNAEKLLNVTGMLHLSGELRGNAVGSLEFNSDNIIVDQNNTVTNNIEGTGIRMPAGWIKGPGFFVNNKVFSIVNHSYNKYFGSSLTFTNNGTMNIGVGQELNSYGNIKIAPDTKLINSSSGTIIMEGSGIENNGDIAGIKFENKGLLKKIGTTSEDINANTKNTGTIQVEAGTLTLNASESFWQNGTYNVFTDGYLNLTGKHHLSGNLNGNVQGNLEFNSNDIVIDTLTTVTNKLKNNGIAMASGSVKGPGTFVNEKVFSITRHSYNKSFSGNLTFTNNGTMELGPGQMLSSYGNIKIDAGSKLINSANGQILMGGAGIQNIGDAVGIKFDNQGFLKKLGTSGEEISANMKNTGTLQIEEGSLTLNAAESFWENGVYNVNESGYLNITGMLHLKGNLTGNTIGNLEFNSNNILVDAGQTVTNNIEGLGIRMPAGWIKGPGSFVNNKVFSIVNHNYNKYFGSSLTFTNNSTMNIGVDQELSSYGNIKIAPETKLINSSNGTIIMEGAGIENNGDATGIKFENNGLLKKIGTTSEEISANMKNTGTIRVETGTLVSNASESFLNGGTYQVQADALLNVTTKHHLKGNLSGNIVGSFEFNSDNIIVDEGDTATNNLNGSGIRMPAGSIKGPGSFVNNKVFSIVNQSYNKYFGSSLTFTNNGTMNIGVGQDLSSFGNIKIENDSKIANSSSGLIVMEGAGIQNVGDATQIKLENSGTIQKIGTYTENIDCQTINNGLVEVQGGRLNLPRFVNDTEGTVSGGDVAFAWNYFTNTGTFNAGPGIESMIIYDFFGSNGTMEFDLNGPATDEYDKIHYGGGYSPLLQINIKVNLGFAPQLNDTFLVFSSSSNFAPDSTMPNNVTAYYNGQDYKFKVIKEASSITLKLTKITASSCPDLSTAPANVTFVDSECQGGCVVGGGVIYAPATSCPEGSHIQYSTDNGATWSADLPVYKQKKSMTIITRCRCDNDSAVVSPSSSPVTTQPGNCDGCGGDTSYKITTKAAPTVGGTTTGDGTYTEGTVVTVKATANTGYKFINWTIGNTEVSTAKNYKHTVTGKVTIKANFEALTYAITTKSIPAAGGTTTGDGTYMYNKKAVLKAVANSGYQFVNWTIGNTVVSTAKNYKHTVTGKATVKANFEPLTYAITTKVAPAAGGTTTGDGTYMYNKKAVLKAVPNSGYQFVNWTIGNTVVSTTKNYKHTVTGKATVKANFVKTGQGAPAERPAEGAEYTFNYYPNPVKDILYFITDAEIQTVKVYNLSGQQILDVEKAKIPDNHLNLSSLPNGLYIIKAVLNDGRIKSFRIVKK